MRNTKFFLTKILKKIYSSINMAFYLVSIFVSFSYLSNLKILAEVGTCEYPSTFSTPSNNFRSVRLEKLNIVIDIPKNYRAMEEIDGTRKGRIHIVNPEMYSYYQCIFSKSGGYPSEWSSDFYISGSLIKAKEYTTNMLVIDYENLHGLKGKIYVQKDNSQEGEMSTGIATFQGKMLNSPIYLDAFTGCVGCEDIPLVEILHMIKNYLKSIRPLN